MSQNESECGDILSFKKCPCILFLERRLPYQDGKSCVEQGMVVVIGFPEIIFRPSFSKDILPPPIWVGF